MAEGVEARVMEIIRVTLGVRDQEIRRDSNFVDDLQVDSLNLVELVYAFEGAFDISIGQEEAEEIRTVDDAIRCVEGKLPGS